MSIFGHPIEGKIDRLERLIPDVHTGFHWGMEVDRHDWRPIWALCKEIQEAFNTTRDFDSKATRQVAWERFCKIRARASELANSEKEAFQDQSTRLRDDLLSELKPVGWSPFTDIMFFFDPTTIEEIKAMSGILKEVGRKLGDKKHLMLGEHKAEVFERIKEKRQELDQFWERKREAQDERHREFEERRDTWRAKVRANLQRNREKLDAAEAAAERVRDRISENESKLRETNSPKWEQIFSEWIDKDQDKLSDIEDSISRIRSWIDEDEDKLSN